MRLHWFLLILLLVCACKHKQPESVTNKSFINPLIKTEDLEQTEREIEVSKILSNDFVKEWNTNIKPGDPFYMDEYIVYAKGPITVEEFDIEMGINDEKIEEIKNERFKRELMHFRGNYKPNDEIFYFTSDEKSWGALIGTAGYIIVRENKIIAIIITCLN